jgi:hypothetical protein
LEWPEYTAAIPGAKPPIHTVKVGSSENQRPVSETQSRSGRKGRREESCQEKFNSGINLDI